jgi:hypothetical protein
VILVSCPYTKERDQTVCKLAKEAGVEVIHKLVRANILVRTLYSLGSAGPYAVLGTRRHRRE